MSNESKKRLRFFERYLTAGVALCMMAGVTLGKMLSLLKTSSALYQDVLERRRVRILDPYLHVNDHGSLAVRENQHLARLGFLAQAARRSYR